MVGLGIVLIILGFGSLILEQMGYVFRILAWADDYQPGIGIGVGVLGVVLVIVGIVLNNRKNTTNVTINNAPPVEGQPPQQWAPPAGQPVQNDPRYNQPQQYGDNPPRD